MFIENVNRYQLVNIKFFSCLFDANMFCINFTQQPNRNQSTQQSNLSSERKQQAFTFRKSVAAF
ncbi:MAG: hypothetical protein D3913_07760 [Candidatus Electrothrix sp. LOE1_4_5]|nr:hypothetical protein [Candidatus Electrothrix gigas]